MKKSYLLNIVKNFNIPYYFSTAHNRLINDCQNKDDFFHFLEKKKGYLIKTSCDTELIAPGYKFYGEKFFSLIEGMFAFAICDLSKNKLIISRDRYGTKPLYYSIIDNELYFSSSAKSIYNLSFFKKKINIESLQSVLNKRYVEEAKHIFCDIDQLIPGGILEFKDQKLFIQKLEDNKMLTIRAAENVVRILPPLNVKKYEINLGIKIIRKVCKEL